MAEKKLEKDLKKWWGLESSPEKVASVLFVISNGDGRKVHASYKNPDGVYGAAASKLFDDNSELHRYLLHNVFFTNKKGVKVSEKSIKAIST